MSTDLVKKQYIQDETGVVYKDCSTHFLQLSPWEVGSDRRIMENDIGNYKYISYQNACMIVIQQFNKTTEKWEFDGKKYIADAIGTETNKEAYANMSGCRRGQCFTWCPTEIVWLRRQHQT